MQSPPEPGVTPRMKEDISNKGSSPLLSLPMPGAWKDSPSPSLSALPQGKRAGQPVNQGGILPHGSRESPEKLPLLGSLPASPALAQLEKHWVQSQGCNESWQLLCAPTRTGDHAGSGSFVSSLAPGCGQGHLLCRRDCVQRESPVSGAMTKPSAAISTHWSSTAALNQLLGRFFLLCLEW